MRFKTYMGMMNEKHQLTHLDHLEDLIFLKGHKGGQETIDYLEAIIHEVGAHETKNVTIKIDGAPSLIAGYSPEDGRFFVGTKAFFNATPKVNYTAEDIDKNHGHAAGLAQKLKEALKYLPGSINKGNIIQGDFIFGVGDLKYETIDDVKGVSFTPNTIKYFVDLTSKMYKSVTKAKIGIMWHTTYNGNTLDSLQGSFKISDSSFKMTSDVYAQAVNVKLDTLAWTPNEKSVLLKDLNELKKAIGNLNTKGIQSLDKIAGTDVSREIMTFINTKVRNGTKFTRSIIRDLITYIITKYDGRKIGVKKKFKTQKTIDSKTDALDIQKKKLVDTLSGMASELFYLFQWYYNVAEMKEIIVDKLNSLKTAETPYIIQSDGTFVLSDPEGWVISNGPGSGVKFINRSVFSAANFNNPKFN